MKLLENLRKDYLTRKIFTVNYYTEVLQGKRRFNVFLLSFVLALMLTIWSSVFIYKDVFPFVNNLDKQAKSIVEEVYPKELKITIRNGIASTNVTEPYYISINRQKLEQIFSPAKKDKITTSSKVRLLAIDTKGKAEDFESYQSIALLTQTSIVYFQDNDVKIYSLREIGDLTITKDGNIDQINKIKNGPIGKIVIAALLISPIFILLFWFVSTLILLALLAIPVYIMMRLNNQNFGFKRAIGLTASAFFIISLLDSLISIVLGNKGYIVKYSDLIAYLFTFALSYIAIKNSK